MSDNFKQVEGEADLVRDMNSTAIINRNKSAYEMAKKRAEQAKKKLICLLYTSDAADEP